MSSFSSSSSLERGGAASSRISDAFASPCRGDLQMSETRKMLRDRKRLEAQIAEEKYVADLERENQKLAAYLNTTLPKKLEAMTQTFDQALQSRVSALEAKVVSVFRDRLGIDFAAPCVRNCGAERSVPQPQGHAGAGPSSGMSSTGGYTDSSSDCKSFEEIVGNAVARHWASVLNKNGFPASAVAPQHQDNPRVRKQNADCVDEVEGVLPAIIERARESWRVDVRESVLPDVLGVALCQPGAIEARLDSTAEALRAGSLDGEQRSGVLSAALAEAREALSTGIGRASETAAQRLEDHISKQATAHSDLRAEVLAVHERFAQLRAQVEEDRGSARQFRDRMSAELEFWQRDLSQKLIGNVMWQDGGSGSINAQKKLLNNMDDGKRKDNAVTMICTASVSSRMGTDEGVEQLQMMGGAVHKTASIDHETPIPRKAHEGTHHGGSALVTWKTCTNYVRAELKEGKFSIPTSLSGCEMNCGEIEQEEIFDDALTDSGHTCSSEPPSAPSPEPLSSGGGPEAPSSDERLAVTTFAGARIVQEASSRNSAEDHAFNDNLILQPMLSAAGRYGSASRSDRSPDNLENEKGPHSEEYSGPSSSSVQGDGGLVHQIAHDVFNRNIAQLKRQLFDLEYVRHQSELVQRDVPSLQRRTQQLEARFDTGAFLEPLFRQQEEKLLAWWQNELESQVTATSRVLEAKCQHLVENAEQRQQLALSIAGAEHCREAQAAVSLGSRQQDERLQQFTRLQKAHLLAVSAENRRLMDELRGLKLQVSGPAEFVWPLPAIAEKCITSRVFPLRNLDCQLLLYPAGRLCSQPGYAAIVLKRVVDNAGAEASRDGKHQHENSTSPSEQHDSCNDNIVDVREHLRNHHQRATCSTSAGGGGVVPLATPRTVVSRNPFDEAAQPVAADKSPRWGMKNRRGARSRSPSTVFSSGRRSMLPQDATTPNGRVKVQFLFENQVYCADDTWQNFENKSLAVLIDNFLPGDRLREGLKVAVRVLTT
ncbi:unnamed protein product [Amoebophrya sp. A25]|nr:unnamed protein product [Amoebophrya sp. A25]|eukprot:GSA25T00023587001.1